MSQQKSTVSPPAATESEKEEAFNAINGLTINEILLRVKKCESVKKKTDRKSKEKALFYGRNRIDNLTRSQLIDILMEDLSGKFNFESDEENKGHSLQQELDIVNKELAKAKEALNGYKKKAEAESKVKDDKISELQGLINSMDNPTTVFEDVRQFTAISKQLTDSPRAITKEAYAQIKLFIKDEFEELGVALNKPNEVADWIVDHIYYILNFASKNGYNLAPVWNLVQEANMRKFPNGKAKFNKDGKVVKPKGWKSNDDKVEKEINRQIESGAWK